MSSYDIDHFQHSVSRRKVGTISKSSKHLQSTTNTDDNTTNNTNTPTTTPTPNSINHKINEHPLSNTQHFNQLAEKRRIHIQSKLGTDLEQLTRQYAERLQAQHILNMHKETTTTTTTTPTTTRAPTPKQTNQLKSDFFEAQIMLVEPHMLSYENNKSKGKKPMTDLLLRILLICQEANGALLGWDDSKMNKVARKRLRQILDFEQDKPLEAGIVYDLEQEIPLTAPLHRTITYFTNLEYNLETDPIKPILEKYFNKTYGVHVTQTKSYAFDQKTKDPMLMQIADILGAAASGLRSNLKLRVRKHEQTFLDHNINTGGDLYRMCWKKFPKVIEEIDATKAPEEWKLENVDLGLENIMDTKTEIDLNAHDETNGKPITKHLLESPFNMHPQDIWRILALVQIRNPEIVAKEQQDLQKKLQKHNTIADAANTQAVKAAKETHAMIEAMGDEYADPKDTDRVQQKRKEAKEMHREKIKEKRRQLKKEKKAAKKALKKLQQEEAETGSQSSQPKPKPKPKQKISKRKKMAMLKKLRDKERAIQKAKDDAEYHAAHSNSEGNEFKRKAYLPSKAAIMLNERNYYDDARLSTRRPGSRNSVFEPALEDTAYGKAKIQNGEMKRRGTEYIFKQPKGHLKDLARFNLTLVRPPTKEQKRMYRMNKKKEIEQLNKIENQKSRFERKKSPPKKNKRPQSTDYKPIPLHSKTDKDNTRIKEQRFGSLRNLDRAVTRSKQMLTEILSIPTTASQEEMEQFGEYRTDNGRHQQQRGNKNWGKLRMAVKATGAFAQHKTLADMQEYDNNDDNNSAINEEYQNMNHNMETLVLEDIEMMDGVDDVVYTEAPDPNVDPDEDLEDDGLDPPILYDDDGIPMYRGEDGNYYYDEEDDDW